MLSLFQFIRAVGSATLANMIGRAANVLIPLTVIALYGASPYTDQFFFYLALAFYFYSTLSYAAQESSVPIYIVTRRSITSPGILGIGVVTGTVLYLAMLAWLMTGTDTTCWYAFGFALMSGAGIANGFAAGILHAASKFTSPGITWSLRIVPLAIFVLTHQPSENLHFLALGIGMADWVRLGLLLLLRPREAHGHQFWGPWAYLKRHLSEFAPLALAMVFMGLNPIIDRLISNISGPGSLSILDAGERLFGILATLCTLGLMTVVLTRLSQAVVDQNLEKEWGATIKLACMWGGLWLFAGLLIGYGFFGEWISNTTALTELQSRTVQKTYWCYLPGLIPFTISIVYIKRMQAIQRTWTLALISLAMMVLNIPSSLIMHGFMGVPGIALATTLVYTAHALLLVLLVHRRTGG